MNTHGPKGYRTAALLRHLPMLRMLRRVCGFALVAAASLPGPARAQIVNVQPLVSAPSAEGLVASLAGEIQWKTGNTELLDAAGEAVMRYRVGPHTLIGAARARRANESGAPFINQTFEHLRYLHQLAHWVDAETFVQHVYDQFRRLRMRALWGLGPRAHLLVSEHLDLTVGTSYMLEFEVLTSDEELLSHRSSTYLSAKARINDRLSLLHTTHVQPRLGFVQDTRLASETSLVVDASAWLSVKLAFTVAHDARPPQGVKRTDTALKTVLVLRFEPPPQIVDPQV